MGEVRHKTYDGVFEGGGVKGIALIGAVKRMEEQGVSFSRVAGSSAGAIAAALISAGYTADEVKAILWDKDLSEFADVRALSEKGWRIFFSTHILKLFTLFSYRRGYGIFSTDRFYMWIRQLLRAKGITDFKSVPVYLRVFAVDVLKQRLLQFDRDTTPGMEVAEAVRMSMSIPLFFRANRVGDGLVVDGGVLANYPVSTFDDSGGLVSTIGFKLISEAGGAPGPYPKNVLSYIMRIFDTLRSALERVHVEKAQWARTVPIPTGRISTVKFDLSDAEKGVLWDAGYNAAEKAIREGLLTEGGRV